MLAARARTLSRRLRRTACVAGAVAVLPFATGAQNININVGSTVSTIIAPGAEIVVPVIIDLSNAGSLNIASLQATLSWNPGRLTFDSLRVASGVTWALFTNTANAATGSISFNAFDAVAFPASGPLVNAYFTAAASDGGTLVLLAPTAAGNAAGTSILGAVRPRSLNACVATGGRVGDVNADDAVNIIDAQQISRFAVGLSVSNLTVLQQRGDVNASGTVDIIDGQQIARFSVGLSAAPLINTLSTFIPAATAVTVSPAGAQTLATGSSRQMIATPTAGATNLTGCAPVTWQTSNATVAVVNASGFVTAIGGGSVSITATSGLVSAPVSAFTVSGSSAGPVASVVVTLSNPLVTVGGTVQATAVLRDAANALITGRPIAWTSSNPAAATVNPTTGLVTGVAAGTTTITATAEGVSGQATATVQVTPVASVSVTLNPSSVTLGQTSQASAITRDASNNTLTGRVVTWSSSSTAVATVNSTTGLITSVGSGTTNIIATSEGVMGQATLTVGVAAVASITISFARSPLPATTPTVTTTQATAVLRDANNNVLTGRTVTWSSSNTARATVNSSTGVVTAVTPGTADIIATSEGVTSVRQISMITPPVTQVRVTLNASSIIPGSTTTATAVTLDERNNMLTGRSVTFASSNTLVATAVSTGTVTGIANGTANIVGTSEGVNGSAPVTVGQVVSNEPAGMTLISERPFNCQKPTECESDWNFSGSGFTIAVDPLAPVSASNVGQMRYPAGMAGGVGPAQTWRGLGNKKVVYFSMYIKWSDNFQNHSSGVNKVFHVWINGINRIVLIGKGSSLSTVMALQQLAAAYNNGTGQNATSVHLSPNIVPSAVMTRGVWHRIEIIMTANTPGVADGAVTWFQNGVKVGEYSGIMYAAAGGNGAWEQMNWNPTWGGIGGTVTEDMYMWLDHLYASGKN